MIAFSDRFTRMFLLIVNGLFIAIGMGMMAIGIYQSVTTVKLDDDVDDTPSGSVTIVTGCFDIAIGVCGLVGILLNKRALLMVNVGLLVVAILSNLVVIIVYAAVLSSVTANGKAVMKQLIAKRYGNNTDPESKKFTREVDDYHNDEACCGWSADDEANSFRDSPWYRETNAHDPQKPFTLPASCCIKAEDGCQRAINMKEARDKGFVYKFDCMNKIIGRANIVGALFLTQGSIMTLLQIACVVFSVFFLKQQPAAE